MGSRSAQSTSYCAGVTPDQVDAVVRMFVYGSPDDREALRQPLLDLFETSDGTALAVRLVSEAEQHRDAGEVEAALLVALAFGMNDALLGSLKRLAREPWHDRHQDISQYLVEVGHGDDVVDELEFLAWAGPQYQDYDGSTALARHAVHGLEQVATPRARGALARLREHPEPDVRALVDRVEKRLPPG